jgi:hypothetical protein
LALTALGGCSSTGQRIERAGAQLGVAQAGVQLPAWPAHCRQPVPHAPAVAGDDAIGVLRLERQQLDFANRRAANCGNFYDTLRQGLSD